MSDPHPLDGACEESLEDLYEDAPCGYLSALPDGRLVRVNRTLLAWTGYSADELLAGKRFPELLTTAGALFYETHCAPLLRLQGAISEIAVDLVGRDGRLVPVLLYVVVKKDAAGAQRWLRIVACHITTRREYERELLLARSKAEEAAEQLRVQADLLAEHSALLMPIQDDLRVMPILGAIDPTRGRQILHALLHLDAAAGVRAVILDLTGVPEVDAAAADILRSAVAGLRLRGVRSILTGIRPAVAAGLVGRGIDLTGISVCGTLQDGIALANRRAGAR